MKNLNRLEAREGSVAKKEDKAKTSKEGEGKRERLKSCRRLLKKKRTRKNLIKRRKK